MKDNKYCMPDGIETEQDHLEYLKTIGVMNQEGIFVKDRERFKLFLYNVRRSGEFSENFLDEISSCIDEGSKESIADALIRNTKISDTERLLKLLLTYVLSNHYA